MNPKSHTLFHFTKSADVLKLIIKNGFWPRYCLEDVAWLGYDGFDFIAYPMVCFCDIPLSRAEEHVKFYGEYGIGLTKEWAESNKITPILYVSSNNNLKKTFKKIVDNTSHISPEDKKEQAIQNVRYLLAHSKPTEGNMVVAGNLVAKEFYQESEWRYVPKNAAIKDYLRNPEFNDEAILKGNNELTLKHSSIKFTPKDVKYIFVKNDSDIPDIINFIQAELDGYPNADIKVLMSRVTSLESIQRDL
ncbi:MAG: abortive infection system antitoxin AbiGi family protein [Moraxellaceae bacterium]